MSSEVKLVGLDFGTTTSSAVIARARLSRHPITGRGELSDVREILRSPMVFTPFRGEALDEEAIAAQLDAWLAAAGARPEEIAGGGAIVTGLAARKDNAAAVARLVRARLGDAVIAAAGDPHLESWLAFMGSAAPLSLAHPDTPIINLDIGGGTTNLALGLCGQVISTAAIDVGARHVQVEPGGYRIERLAREAEPLFAKLAIDKRPGDTLATAEVSAVLDLQVDQLERTVVELSDPDRPPFLAFSGGVGELIYAALRGDPPLSTTAYGDLGIDLAARILASPGLSSRVLVPESAGRAVSFGLLHHATRVSGSTLFLPRPEVLPLVDLPLVAHLSPASTEAAIAGALDRARRSAAGAAIAISLAPAGPATVKRTGVALRDALQAASFPTDLPLVLLIAENAAKALGGYATAWGRLPLTLIVVDEIAVQSGACFVQLGRLTEQIVPVSFHGLSAMMEPPR